MPCVESISIGARPFHSLPSVTSDEKLSRAYAALEMLIKSVDIPQPFFNNSVMWGMGAWFPQTFNYMNVDEFRNPQTLW